MFNYFSVYFLRWFISANNTFVSERCTHFFYLTAFVCDCVYVSVKLRCQIRGVRDAACDLCDSI